MGHDLYFQLDFTFVDKMYFPLRGISISAYVGLKFLCHQKLTTENERLRNICVMFAKPVLLNYLHQSSEFNTHCVHHSCGLVLYLSHVWFRALRHGITVRKLDQLRLNSEFEIT